MAGLRNAGLASLAFLIGVLSPWPSSGQSSGPSVIIEMDRGKLTLELFPDAAPKTVARFTELVQKGFYNGLTFYRVVPRFLIQGGDPAGDGPGDEVLG
jgi:peptidyl-prolyl cis-trans isomerase B (cyclophilin B)